MELYARYMYGHNQNVLRSTIGDAVQATRLRGLTTSWPVHIPIFRHTTGLYAPRDLGLNPGTQAYK
jgi:hypothetical protein